MADIGNIDTPPPGQQGPVDGGGDNTEMIAENLIQALISMSETGGAVQEKSTEGLPSDTQSSYVESNLNPTTIGPMLEQPNESVSVPSDSSGLGNPWFAPAFMTTFMSIMMEIAKVRSEAALQAVFAKAENIVKEMEQRAASAELTGEIFDAQAAQQMISAVTNMAMGVLSIGMGAYSASRKPPKQQAKEQLQKEHDQVQHNKDYDYDGYTTARNDRDIADNQLKDAQGKYDTAEKNRNDAQQRMDQTDKGTVEYEQAKADKKAAEDEMTLQKDHIKTSTAERDEAQERMDETQPGLNQMEQFQADNKEAQESGDPKYLDESGNPKYLTENDVQDLQTQRQADADAVDPNNAENVNTRADLIQQKQVTAVQQFHEATQSISKSIEGILNANLEKFRGELESLKQAIDAMASVFQSSLSSWDTTLKEESQGFSDILNKAMEAYRANMNAFLWKGRGG